MQARGQASFQAGGYETGPNDPAPMQPHSWPNKDAEKVLIPSHMVLALVVKFYFFQFLSFFCSSSVIVKGFLFNSILWALGTDIHFRFRKGICKRLQNLEHGFIRIKDNLNKKRFIWKSSTELILVSFFTKFLSVQVRAHVF